MFIFLKKNILDLVVALWDLFEYGVLLFVTSPLPFFFFFLSVARSVCNLFFSTRSNFLL